jgi:hypothetical protein
VSTKPSNDITELRGHLFDALRSLTDKANPMEIERARAVSDMAQTIINTAKVEVDFIKATGNPGASNFIPLAAPKPTPAPATKPAKPAEDSGAAPGAKIIDQRPGLRVTQHRLGG